MHSLQKWKWKNKCRRHHELEWTRCEDASRKACHAATDARDGRAEARGETGASFRVWDDIQDEDEDDARAVGRGTTRTRERTHVLTREGCR